MPEIKFWLENASRKITLGEEDEQTVLHVKVKDDHRTDNSEIARVPFSFKGSGWGQHGSTVVRALSSRLSQLARAKCKLRLQRPSR